MRWIPGVVILALAGCGSGSGDSLELDTVLVSTQHDFDNTGRPTFVFQATLSGASFSCRLDGGPDTVVDDRLTVEGLDDGPHRLEVVATLPDGTSDETPLVVDWTQDTRLPALAIAFPPPISGTDLDVVAVCGTARDEIGVASVTVNGVEAHIVDGAWRAEVPVIRSGALDVVCRDRAGNEVRGTGPVVVALGKRSSLYNAIAWDATRARALLLAPNAFYALGKNGPEPVAAGGGLALLDPVLVEEHPTRDTVLVFDAFECRLFEIGLASGERTLHPVAGADITADTSGMMTTDGKEAFVQGPRKVPLVGVDLKTGATRDVLAGDWAVQPRGMAYDAGRDRILVVEAADDTVLAIDPTTGAKSVASTPSLAYGSTVGTKRGLVVDGDVAYALGNGGAWLVRIDLATGDRTTTRLDTPIPGARDIAIDRAAGRLIVADADADGVTRIDLATGAVARDAAEVVPLGTGPRIERPDDVFCDPDRLRIVVVERNPRRFMAIDCMTADREDLHPIPQDALRIDLRPGGDGAVVIHGKQAVSVDATGATASVALGDWARGVVYDHQRDTALVTTSRMDNDTPQVWLLPVDPAAGTVGPGERILVNTLPDSLRPRLEVTGAMAFDRESGAVFMGARHVDSHEGSILERDRDGTIRTVTGVWGEGDSVLKDAGRFDDPTDLAVDPAHDRLLAVRWNSETVLAIDLASGRREVLSGPNRGVGPRIGFPRSIDVDPVANIAYVASTKGVLAIDLETGDRVLLTG